MARRGAVASTGVDVDVDVNVDVHVDVGVGVGVTVWPSTSLSHQAVEVGAI